jgi:hypothetical protein
MLNITFPNGNFMKNLATFLIIAVICGMWGYYFYRQNQLPFLKKPPVAIIPTPTVDIPVYPSITMAASKSSQDNDILQIKQAFAAKYGRKPDDVDLNLSADNGSYAIGTVNFKLAMEGGQILAAKAADEWVVVFDGNGSVSCSTLSQYNFPQTMVSECVNSNGKLVKL